MRQLFILVLPIIGVLSVYSCCYSTILVSDESATLAVSGRTTFYRSRRSEVSHFNAFNRFTLQNYEMDFDPQGYTVVKRRVA